MSLKHERSAAAELVLEALPTLLSTCQKAIPRTLDASDSELLASLFPYHLSL